LVLRCFGVSMLRCFSASVVQCFGASVLVRMSSVRVSVSGSVQARSACCNALVFRRDFACAPTLVDFQSPVVLLMPNDGRLLH
jgi:hypothetical protein